MGSLGPYEHHRRGVSDEGGLRKPWRECGSEAGSSGSVGKRTAFMGGSR